MVFRFSTCLDLIFWVKTGIIRLSTACRLLVEEIDRIEGRDFALTQILASNRFGKVFSVMINFLEASTLLTDVLEFILVPQIETGGFYSFPTSRA